MRLRKWFVRSVVFGALALMVAAFLLYQHWTNPSVVREQVISSLETQLPNTDIKLEGARLRILGGIWLNDLRIVRRDDPNKIDLAYIPAGVIYHNKEKLIEGTLLFRKVELYRPRIHLIRNKEGRWNFENLYDSKGPALSMPTTVIREGTLLIEDRFTAEGLPIIEVNDIEMTLINDPINTIRIEATGESYSLGRLNIKGSYNRDTHKFDIHLKTNELLVNNTLMNRLAGGCRMQKKQNYHIQAKADGDVTVRYDPGAKTPLDFVADWNLYEGQLTHPQIPLPITDLRIKARVHNDHLSVKKLTAKAGTAQVTGHCETIVPCVDQYFEGEVTVRDLPVTAEFCKRLPENVRKFYPMFTPAGKVAVQLSVKKEAGKWYRHEYVLRPNKMFAKFRGFPYPARNITGKLEIDALTKSTKIDLTAHDYPRTIEMKGHWNGLGKDADVNLRLFAREVPLDKTLIRALPEQIQKLTRSFNPSGFCHVTTQISHVPGTDKFCNEYHARFYDASVSWDGFPYRLSKVTGLLDIYPEHWEFREFQGYHKDGKFSAYGRSEPTVSGPSRVIIGITGRNIGIDEDLRQALEPIPGLAKAWDTIVPRGQLDFQTVIDQIPGRPQDMDVALDLNGCSIEPTFFRYPLTDLSGHFRFTGNRLAISDLKARHLASRVSIEKGTVDLSPRGGYYADLHNVRGNPIFPTDGFAAALPESLQQVFQALDLHDPVAVQTRVVVAQTEEPGSLPDVFWDGQLWLKRANLNIGSELSELTGTMACIGRYDGRQLRGLHGNIVLDKVTLLQQPFENVLARIRIPKEMPDVLLVDLKAPIFDGDISGQARIDFNSVMRYEMDLTASQIDLSKFGKHNLGNKMELEGAASARLHLTGQGKNAMESLDGNGIITIPNGKLYNLPLLLDLLKFLGLRWPDRTAFEQGLAKFSIQGPRVEFQQLELWGNAISVKGQGGVNLDGTNVQLEFYPSWARVEQLLPGPLREMSPMVSKNLLKIEVQGNITSRPEDLKFLKRPVPLIVDPLMDLRNRVARMQKGKTDRK